MELLKVDTIASARDKLVSVMQYKRFDTVYKKLLETQGCILAQDLVSQESIPAFRRSTVDGYAVISGDTTGASESLPAFLENVDEVHMGSPAIRAIHSGECVYVPTGGMVPPEAEAMVMVEYCELFDERHIAVYHPAPYGKNIISIGEDINEDDIVLRKGTRIRPQEIGAMASLGITEVLVFKPWNITILSTGDELVPPYEVPSLGKIRDINSYSLCAQAQKYGLTVRNTMVLKDDEQELKTAVIEAMKVSDVVIISGGSSQGKKDATNSIIEEVTSMGSFVHGLALKPGKPTILGYDGNTNALVAGLPGHPVAAMLVFELLIIWLWKHMTNQAQDKSVYAHITSNLAGAPGKITCQLVKLIKQENEYYAQPVMGKSGLITTLTRADGYIMIEQNKEGLKKDEMVEVFFL